MKHNPFPRQQHGAALITALIILVIITVLGVAGLSDSTQQEVMVSNTMLRQMAFQGTETTLRDAEDTVDNLPDLRPTKGSLTTDSDFSVTNFFMAQRTYNDKATLVSVLRADADADPSCSTDSNSINIKCLGDETGYAAFPSTPDPDNPNTMIVWTKQPRYVKEYLTNSREMGTDPLDATSDSATYFYRTSAWGTDPSEASEVVLQTTFARRFDFPE